MVVEVPADVLDTECRISLPSDEQILRLGQAVSCAVARDAVAADVKWSLFVAASQSYRHDSCLRPFPPMFIKDGVKDFDGLLQAVQSVPAFDHLEPSRLSKQAVLLLHWVLVELKEPSLSTVDRSEVEDVLGLVLCELSPPRPSLVVRLDRNTSSAAEQRWAEASRRHGFLHAFHGSRVDNFHSILHHGLQQHLTKNTLFGQGVYLSSELLVCLPYSRTGLGWRNSCLGSPWSVVALCQVVNDPLVLCQPELDNEKRKLRVRAEDSMAGDVPHKLYVVPNSDLIRVRYLLVYAARNPPATGPRLKHQNTGFLSWLGRHKMAVSLAVYAVLLTSVGLSRSPVFLRLWLEIRNAIGL